MEKENKKQRKWSKEEVSRLRQIMTRYTVDKEGVAAASQELDRSCTAVRVKWNKIKPDKRSYGYTEEIIKALYTNVSKNPGNISEAFRQTAEQTGKSVHSLHNIYYDKNSPYNRSKMSTCFMMASKHHMAANAKIYDSSEMPKTTKQRIKLWIASMLGIKKEDL